MCQQELAQLRLTIIKTYSDLSKHLASCYSSQKRALCLLVDNVKKTDDSFLSVYERKVKNKEIESDEYKLRVAKTFQGVDEQLKGYKLIKSNFSSKIFKQQNKPNRIVKGLYLYGSVGCGKTMLMDLFYQNCHVDEYNKKRIHFHSFMLDVHSRIHEQKKKPSATSSRKALSYNPIPRFWILDSDIDYRQKSLPSKQNIKRRRKADKELDRLFKIFASRETDNVRPKTIVIKGRNVKFAKTCGRVLDSSFSELCDRPLGAVDYLTLSQLFHTVIIRDIPQLNLKLKTQARRFITLIDTFYDNKVRVLFAQMF
ncbi:protein AFG1-like [Tetranychus urticae]|uniref:protein AFG1-like n=1 Tax=Tetranychus urticae TaxID=32264 RepID=UPI000D658CD3|nr:protein AFG1-like [Tetranychus urticae]